MKKNERVKLFGPNLRMGWVGPGPPPRSAPAEALPLQTPRQLGLRRGCRRESSRLSPAEDSW